MNKSKFLTDSRNLNIVVILFLITNTILIITGAIYAILGTFMSYHVDYTGLTESEVASYNPKLMILISVFIRLLGVNEMVIGISGIYINIYGIRKKEKWAWNLILIVSTMWFIPTLILTLIITGIFGLPFVLSFIVGIITVIALYISYKDIFK